MKYRCWDPDDSSGEATAREYEAVHARDAAVAYAERRFYRGDPFSSTEVHVRADGGSIRSFTVDAEYDVTFRSKENPVPESESSSAGGTVGLEPASESESVIGDAPEKERP